MPSGSARRPLLIAHRGAAYREPENSLAAFRAAVADGADAIELDVHATSDGGLVVRHDALLGGRPIREQPLAAVRAARLANGEPVPTLSEALEAIGQSAVVFVEIKALDPAYDAALLEALDRGPAPGRYHVHAFDHRIVRRLVARRPGLVAGVLSCSYPVDPFQPLAAAGAAELWQEWPLVDPALLEQAHRLGYRVYAWTVDQPAVMRALAAWGVDGLCTDRVDLAREVIASCA